MCGILGIYGFSVSKPINKQLLSESLLTMQHRGPDANDVQIISNNCTLAHLRLAIIDLKPESNQPFQIDDRYWITYNGEIYNYLELKEELTKVAGYSFRTQGDTEVLLRAYQYWGEDCVNKFNGMWAFAIYDIIENKLFCSRDRFGVKPFNYAIVDNQFIFSSEIKAIIKYFPNLKKPNYNVIANYCRTSVGAQHEETWFENILRIMPAHNLVVSKDGLKQYRYWNYPTKVNKTLTLNQATNQYKEIFESAVKLRMRSDVPVGTTLSSGLDSNSIVYTLRTFFKGVHHTFTAKFNSNEFDTLDNQSYSNKNLKVDETEIVHKVNTELKLTGHFVETNNLEFVNELKNIIYYLESGHCSPAVFPLMEVLKKSKEHVTVVLEGQGADELLGGYQQTLFVASVIEYIKSFNFFKAFKTIKKTTETYSFFYAIKLYVRQKSNEYPWISRLYEKVIGFDGVFLPKLTVTKKIKDFPNNYKYTFDSTINKVLYRQHSGGLVNLLHYGDALSMANSLESRLPFMDYRLVEFAFQLPWEFKLNENIGKFIHRKAMQNLVPNYILDNSLKLGFDTPISQFFKKEFSGENTPRSILMSEKSKKRNLFDTNLLLKLFDEHQEGKKNHSTFLYRLLSVELWFRIYIDENNE
jgi:asparagine synthase (glutamine-hydrolysing)